MKYFVTSSAYFNTIRTVGLSQVVNRSIRRLRSYSCLYPWAASHLFPMPIFTDGGWPAPHGLQAFNEAAAAGSIPREGLLKEAEDLCRHRFAFLNKPLVDLGNPVDWCKASGGDPLWRYCLHYGKWAFILVQAFLATGKKVFRDGLIRLIADWIGHNPVGSRPGWEPYPLSRRIVVWSRVALALAGDEMWNEFWRERLAPSLWQQTRLIEANLEKDLANNHLIANYRALGWMGLLFPNWPQADLWRKVGLTGLWTEMRRQVLPDGVHDERSISYHTIVLQDLLEIWHICQVTGHFVPEDVVHTLRGMFQFLAHMQAPNGSYPMVNDTVPGYPMDPRSVLLAGGRLLGCPELVSCSSGANPSYAAWFGGAALTRDGSKGKTTSRPPVAAYPDAGYVVLQNETGNYLCFDAGPMGPDHLPGHGHADALSFILYGGGRPLIVDPGVYSYHDKSWRDHFRSTAAHNTVSIDGQDQCVFWGAFRVAYPPEVRLLEWSENHVVGEHEGYCRLRRPVLHRRRIERRTSVEWELFDRFEGRGEHDFALTLQLAPGAEAKLNGDAGVSVRWPGGLRLEIIPVSPPSGSKDSIEDGWVSPGWNIKEKAPRYVLRWRSMVPVESRLILKVKN